MPAVANLGALQNAGKSNHCQALGLCFLQSCQVPSLSEQGSNGSLSLPLQLALLLMYLKDCYFLSLSFCMKGCLVKINTNVQLTNFVFLSKISGVRDLVAFAFPP